MVSRRWVAWGALGAIGAGVVGGGACSSADRRWGESIERDTPIASGPACTGTNDGHTVTQHIAVTDTGGPGGKISVIVDRSLEIVRQGFASFEETGSLLIGGASEIFSYSILAVPGQPTHVTVHWGPHVRGAHDATFDITGQTMTGNIDGRVFLPFPLGGDPATATFVDGGPSPKLQTNGPVLEAIKRLEPLVADAIASCNITTTAGVSLHVLSDTTQDPGHVTDTFGAAGCIACKAAVFGTAALGAIACAAQCTATFGISCGNCGEERAAAVAYGDFVCEEGGICCPTRCVGFVGGTSGEECCGSDETCLNAALGLCCSAGKQPCGGQACCASDQTCISTSPSQGTCCPNDSACGNACCTSEGFFTSYCADRASSLCCHTGEVPCAGVCCGGSHECKNDVCVFKQTLNCGTEPQCVTASGQLDPSLCPATDFCASDTGCCAIIPH
jgi:hypothetical protein